MVIVGTADWGIAPLDVFVRDMGKVEWARSRWLVRYLETLFKLDADCNFAVAARRHFQNMGHAIPNFTRDDVDRNVSSILYQRQCAHLRPKESYLKEVGYCAVGLKGAVGTPVEPVNLVAPPGVTISPPTRPVPTATPTPYLVVPPAEPPGEGIRSWVKIGVIGLLAYLLLRK